MKKTLLDKIGHEVSKLNELDVEGHIWWNKFKEFVEETPEPGEQQIIEIDVKNLTNKGDHYTFDKKK
jgi:hypothetical protein